MIYDNLKEAQINGSPVFYSLCATHGRGIFLTERNRCAKCVADLIDQSKAVEAQNAGLKFFIKECPIHGVTDHHVRGLRCRACSPSGRKPRVPTARTAARNSGAQTYLDLCATHGLANFSVRWGRCLQCTTTDGRARILPSRISLPVEKRVSIPPPADAPVSWPFMTMETGDSVAVPRDLLERAKGAMANARRAGRSFTRRVQEDGTIRIWRIG